MKTASHHPLPFLPALIALLLALGLPATAAAEEDERTWYDVEIIVFEQDEAGGRDAERWQAVAPAPRADEVMQLQELDPDHEGSRPAFSRTPGDELQLLRAYQQLERAKEYRPLLHLGWRQQGYSRDEAPSVAVPPGWSLQPAPEVELELDTEDMPGTAAMPDMGEIPDGQPEAPAAGTAHEDTILGQELAATQRAEALYGFVRLYRERFLHVAVDLRYHRDDEDAATRYPYLKGEAPVFVMQQQRRMRSGELHYLDHPVLGVLVLVTPVSLPETLAAPLPEDGEEPVEIEILE